MGFLTIFYKDMIQQYFIVQIFYRTPAPTAPLRPHLRSSEFYKAPNLKYLISSGGGPIHARVPIHAHT